MKGRLALPISVKAAISVASMCFIVTFHPLLAISLHLPTAMALDLNACAHAALGVLSPLTLPI